MAKALWVVSMVRSQI